MTDRIYYTEPSCRSFDATVVIRPNNRRPALITDRTAFYTSGGQPFDTGRLGLSMSSRPSTATTLVRGPDA
jgi:Ser-tRNA(Ala) deacylase AlaX